MYRTILVPLDGSAFGERALPMALEVARATGAQLVLVRAAGASVLPGVDATEAQCQAISEAESYLADEALNLAGQGIQAATAVPFAPAAEAILLEVAMRRADLVIMCTHGRSGLGRWIYGSVAEGVLTRSPVPVLLVRPTGAQPALTPVPGQSCLLVPLDGSAWAEAALPHAAALARNFGCGIQLLTVVAPPRIPYSDMTPTLDMLEAGEAQSKANQTHAHEYLGEAAERLRRDGLRAETAVLEGPPADAILRQAHAIGARLILMATHGRSGLARLLLGSVALEVVHRTLLPVLLVRPTEAPRT
jgi:nucleotide-binding universal stress UspA family protein